MTTWCGKWRFGSAARRLTQTRARSVCDAEEDADNDGGGGGDDDEDDNV